MERPENSIRARRCAPEEPSGWRGGEVQAKAAGSSHVDLRLEPPAVSALATSSLRSALGAARPDSEGGRGVERPDHSSVGGLGSEPDDSVSDVVELRCAGRLGPGRRERFGGDDAHSLVAG